MSGAIAHVRAPLITSANPASVPLDVRGIAAAIPASTVTGRDSLTFRPPWHRSALDRSASLRLSPGNPAGFVVHSFAGDDPMALRDYVRNCLGVPYAGRLSAEPIAAAPTTDRTTRALAVWREGIEPAGTRVELYLRNRGLDLPPDAAGVLRYHPCCPFGPAMYAPCMLALIRSIAGNEPIGVQRIALTADGFKSATHGDPKRVLGAAKGGAVKLAPDDTVALALGVSEGVENALSMARVPEFGTTPSWALLSAPALASLPVLSGIDVLWIAVDRDRAGEEAARAVTGRWTAAGREVRHVRARSAAHDLNACVGGRA